MDRRIYGVETEFGLTHSAPGARPLSPEEAARTLFRPVVAWGRSSNVFLPNGGRLYLDVGSHPEYATAECATLEDLVAQDKAGELIVDDLRRQAQDALAEQGVGGQLYLFKNNVDSRGNYYGSHENYLISRRTEFARLVQILIPFLVTRQLLVGAGRVHPAGPEDFGAVRMGDDAGTPSYSFSQRADHIWEAPPRPRRAPGPSSTPGTSRTPTPSTTAGCTSSWATRRCPRPPRRCGSGPPTSCCG